MNPEDLQFVGPVAEIQITLGDVKNPDGGATPCIVIQGRRTTLVMGIPSVEEMGPLMAEAMALKALHMMASMRASTEAKPSAILQAKPGTRLN